MVLDIETANKMQPAAYAPTRAFGLLARAECMCVVLRGTVNAARQLCRVAAWSLRYVQTVSELMGLPKNRIWVYTGAWFWNPQAGGSSLLKSYPLWVSGYVKGLPPVPKVCILLSL